MPPILGKMFSFALMILFFGFCVFIHEFGHLLAGMWRGLHIERFSVGFGPAIKKWKIKGIEYWLSWIPFGGYVALPQLEPTDTPETFDGQKLPHAKPLDRIIVAFAGPLFNIIFGIFLALIVWGFGYKRDEAGESFVVGGIQAEYKSADGNYLPTPEYGDPDSSDPAKRDGLRPGDRIVAVNGKDLKLGWEGYVESHLFEKGSRRKVTFYRGNEKESRTFEFNTVRNPNDDRSAPLPFIWPQAAGRTTIKALHKGTPGGESELQEGDQIVKINDQEVNSSAEALKVLEKLKPFTAARPITMRVARNGELQAFTVVNGVDPKAPVGNFRYGFTPKEAKGEGTSFLVRWLAEEYQSEKIVRRSPIYAAGLRANDRIVQVGATPLTGGYPQVIELLMQGRGKETALEFMRGKEKEAKRYRIRFTLSEQLNEKAIKEMLQNFTVLVSEVKPGSAAAAAKLQSGDVLVFLQRLEVTDNAKEAIDLFATLERGEGLPEKDTPGSATITVMRAGHKDPITVAAVTPALGDGRWLFGIEFGPPQMRYRPSPISQLTKVFRLTGRTVRSLVDRKNPIKARDMSGPVGIGRGIYRSFTISFILGLQFVGFISISLAIFNLLPLPILDGGHILLAVTEMVTSKKVPAKVMRPIFYTFFVLLIGFALYVTFWDVSPALPSMGSGDTGAKPELVEEPKGTETPPKPDEGGSPPPKPPEKPEESGPATQ